MGVMRESECTKDHRLSPSASLAALTTGSISLKQDLFNVETVSYSSICTHVGQGGEQLAPLKNRPMRAGLSIGEDSRHVTISTFQMLWPSFHVRHFIPDGYQVFKAGESYQQLCCIFFPTDNDQDQVGR